MPRFNSVSVRGRVWVWACITFGGLSIAAMCPPPHPPAPVPTPVPTPSPVPSPPATTGYQLTIGVTDAQGHALVGSTAYTDAHPDPQSSWVGDSGSASFYYEHAGFNACAKKDGYTTECGPVTYPQDQTVALVLPATLPPAPSRDALLDCTLRMQGVTVTTQQFGTFPAFGPEIVSLDNHADRLAYYAAQKAAGATCLIMGWAGGTYSSGGYTYPVPGPDMRWANDLSGFADRVAEAINEGGFTGVYLFLPGDGFTQPDNPYGYQFVMAHTPALLTALQQYRLGDLTRYVVTIPGYDGIVWTWPEQDIIDYAHMIRGVVPNAVMAIENPAGVLGPYGEGREQYDDPNRMGLFDSIMQEYAAPPDSNMDQVWQIEKRFVGRAYERPPDQPADDDPGTVDSVLSGGTPRGRFGHKSLEIDTYDWVRGRITVDRLNYWRAYFKALGSKDVG